MARWHKNLDSLIWRVRLRAIKATIDALIDLKVLSDEDAANSGLGYRRGEALIGRLGEAPVRREVLERAVMDVLWRTPLSQEQPVRVLDDVVPYEVVIDG